MKFFILMTIFSTVALAKSTSQEKELFAAKISFESKAYELKVAEEQEFIKIKNKKYMSFEEDLTSSNKNLSFLTSSCVEWVYQGSASREESIRLCQSVYGVDCLNFVYQGSASREQSARACQGVSSIECVEFVYQGPLSREQSAQACQDVIDMSCVRFAYEGPASREQAARACQRGPRNPRRPQDC